MTDRRRWRKSTFSDDQANCVELAALDADTVGIRDSKNPDAGHLALTRPQVADLVSAIKAGDYDDLI